VQVEYVVVDGDSDDGTVEIIQEFAPQLAHWVSEPDHGQYNAINKGFARTTGDIMAWLNSDDKYLPWAFDVVTEIFTLFPDIQWLTTLYPLTWDGLGRAVDCSSPRAFNGRAFLRGENLPGPGQTAWIQQESTFWRRSLWDQAGGYLDESISLAADFDLWARFFQHAELWGVGVPLAGFRIQGDQKTDKSLTEYVEQAKSVLRRYGRRPYTRTEVQLGRVLRRLPPPVRRLAARTDLIHPRPVCIYRGRPGRWMLSQSW
jgi:glycosyltransferase involved in cell wall biosynthesis